MRNKIIKPLFKSIIATFFILANAISIFANTHLPSYDFGDIGRPQISVPSNSFGANESSIHFNVNVSGIASGIHFNNVARQYQDGEFLGTLTIHKQNRIINIYEGESMASMDKGGGRFSFGGLNYGNTSIIGHNRGRTNGFFIFVKDLEEGDLLTLEAGGVIRTYAVTMVYTVSENDFSPLMQFSDNRLTLVTCVENVQHLRRIAVAVEVF